MKLFAERSGMFRARHLFILSPCHIKPVPCTVTPTTLTLC